MWNLLVLAFEYANTAGVFKLLFSIKNSFMINLLALYWTASPGQG